MTIAELEPVSVWRHFATLCNIPRPSKHEGALRDHLLAWAAERSIAARVDAAGNLILTKPATPGMADRPGVILQGHLDMVCQQNAGGRHDFLRDPIRPVLRDGWLVAEQTTLGADNGIGVALALATLDADDLAHGPLEVLLTVDEEAGMGGAQGLAPGELTGSLLINLDTEDWGEVYVGCAGGVDVNIAFDCGVEPLPPGHDAATLAITGLVGGHSGVDIHLERGNAIKLLIRLLRALDADGVRLAAFSGGTARNALPREAFATIAFPATMRQTVGHRVAAFEALLRDELAGVDDGVRVHLDAGEASTVIAAADQRRLLAAFHAAPHGVRRTSRRVAGVVETSNNLGILSLADGACRANFMVRSLRDSGSLELAAEIADLFALAGVSAATEGAYPGWTPDPDSPLLALLRQTYAREFSGTAAVKVIHAGLECGIIGARYPGIDMVSFGPDIRGAHAPGERVRVESVGHAWRLLRAVLAAIPPRT